MEWAANPHRENPSCLQYTAIQGQVVVSTAPSTIKTFQECEGDRTAGKYRDLYFLSLNLKRITLKNKKNEILHTQCKYVCVTKLQYHSMILASLNILGTTCCTSPTHFATSNQCLLSVSSNQCLLSVSSWKSLVSGKLCLKHAFNQCFLQGWNCKQLKLRAPQLGFVLQVLVQQY